MNCHECGHENPDAARFCNDCGNRLVRDKQADERKQLTVVFADLVDSTRLAARLDPEDWSDAVKRYQSVCQTCVARYDGHIAQYLGDGVLVYFGYPVTYEDSAARALHCALAMRKGLDAINPELSVDLGIELQMRIGVHTGPVVVGKVGRGAQSETLALGNTPNVAARLQGLAPPDGIAVSQLTLDLAGGGFSGKALGAQNLKGLEKPLETSLLEDYNTATETLAPTFFFGRKTQLAQMQELWLQVVARSAQAAVIVGEPGIGKSSFTRAFRTTLGESEHNWLAIRCSAFESGAPFASLIAGLQRYLALADSMGRAHLGALDERERSSMHDFLVLPPNAELPVIGSQIEKRELFIQGVIELLKLAAEERPLVLCMEDIHWVDPSTLELLYHLTQQTRESAILVLLTARSEPEHPVSPIHRITLGALPAEDIAALISELLGDVDPDEVAALAKRCNGIPLFAEELAKSFDRNSEATPDAVPPALRDLLRAQLDGLGRVRETAQAAALLGQDFSRELLLRVMNIDGSAAAQHIDQLLSQKILVESEPGNLQFRHALIQEEAYSSILRRDRRRSHNEAAEILTAEFADTPPHVLAHHWSEAANAETAAPLWHKAARQASSAFAHEEALRHLQRGLAEIEKIAEAPFRNRWELRLQLSLGQTLSSLHSYYDDGVAAAYQRARDISAEIEDQATLFESLATLQGASVARERIEHSRELASQLREVAAELPGQKFTSTANVLSGMTEYAAGNMQGAIEWFLPITQLLQAGDQHAAVTPIADLADAYLGPAYWMAGQPDPALSQSEAALARARASASGITLLHVNVLNCGAQVYTLCEQFDKAAELGREYKLLAENHGHHQHTLTGTYLEGIALGYAEKVAAAGRDNLQLLLDLNEQVRFEGMDIYFSWFQVDIGTLLIRAGRQAEARTVVERTIAVLGEFGGGTNLAPLLNLRAITLMESEPKLAEQLWREALDHATAGGSLGWAALIVDSYADFLRGRQRDAEIEGLRAALVPSHITR